MKYPQDDTRPYQELVCAIVRQTVYDYRKQDERHAAAVLFLRSREAQEFCEAWGLDLGYISERLGRIGTTPGEGLG
jgi:hypothetical protein